MDEHDKNPFKFIMGGPAPYNPAKVDDLISYEKSLKESYGIQIEGMDLRRNTVIGGLIIFTAINLILYILNEIFNISLGFWVVIDLVYVGLVLTTYLTADFGLQKRAFNNWYRRERDLLDIDLTAEVRKDKKEEKK